jgi:hypothetical protein
MTLCGVEAFDWVVLEANAYNDRTFLRCGICREVAEEHDLTVSSAVKPW